VLTEYDLPDLLACIAPRKVVLTGVRNELLQLASPAQVDLELKFPRAVYTIKGKAENLRIAERARNDFSIMSWLFE
jgi:hypothetical protein